MQKSLIQSAVNRVTAATLEKSRARTKDNYWVCPSEEADAREEVSVRWRGQKSGWELEGAMITQGQDPSSRERERWLHSEDVASKLWCPGGMEGNQDNWGKHRSIFSCKVEDISTS